MNKIATEIDPEKEYERRQNIHRVAGVKKILDAKPYFAKTETPRTAAVDLLTNLMHYAFANGFDFDDALDSAREHFEFER